jgi:DNA-binding PucR family transcriptional regulator
VSTVADVPRSREEADLVLRALADDDQDRRWAHIEELRAQTVLLRLRDVAAADPYLSDGPLLTLVDHDSSKDSSYVETLRAYLAAFGDVTAAAASLNVHPNTFRYRLRRLVEISGIDLDDPEQRLVAELQLQFLS